jgi:hypothetical protein
VRARIPPGNDEVPEDETIGLVGAVRMLGKTRWSGTAAVIEAVVNGELTPLDWDESRGLASLRFRRDDLERALVAHREETLPGHTLTEAGRKLWIKEEVARHLVNQGLLEGAKAKLGGKDVWYVTDEALRAFHRTYVFARDLAKQGRTSPRAVTEGLLLEGIHPVSGPPVDGGRQYLFRRGDVSCYVPPVPRRMRRLPNSLPRRPTSTPA